MAKLRIFIAGHVIGLSDPEKEQERAEIKDVAELFDELGFDVVTPLELIDDASNPKDVMCKYFRMMMDCGHYYEFPDYMEHEECHAASLLAIVMNIIPCRAEWSLLNKVQRLVNAITSVMGIPFDKYSMTKDSEGARKKKTQQARTIFVRKCLDMGVEYDDIARFLKREPGQAIINKIERDKLNFDRNIGKWNKEILTDDEDEFRGYVLEIERIVKNSMNNPNDLDEPETSNEH